MEFKGTKGRWVVHVRDGRSGTYFSIDSVNSRVCNINPKRIELFKEEEANALIISKAPEMLDFIIRISGEMLRSDFVLSDKWYEQARQLIKEATEL